MWFEKFKYDVWKRGTLNEESSHLSASDLEAEHEENSLADASWNLESFELTRFSARPVTRQGLKSSAVLS